MGPSSTLQAIFLKALEKTSPEERAAYLDEACAGAPRLRQAVEKLLQAHAEAGSLLQPGQPAPMETQDFVPATVHEGPGARLGPYRLLQQIGEGGMGTVFLAEQEQPVRRHVVAVLADADSGQVCWQIPDLGFSAWSALFSPDGRQVFLHGVDVARGMAQLLDASSGRVRHSLMMEPNQFGKFLFTPDSRRLLGFSSKGDTIHVWDVEVGQELGMLPIRTASGWRFSRDGHRLLGRRLEWQQLPPGQAIEVLDATPLPD